MASQPTVPSRQYDLIAVDTETTGLNPETHSLLGFSIAWRDSNGSLQSKYVPVGHRQSLFEKNVEWDEAVSMLQRVKAGAKTLVFHTAPFDIRFLRTLDPSFDVDDFIDVSTLAHMLGLDAEVEGRLSRSLLNLYDAHFTMSKEMRNKLKGLKKERVHLADRFPSEVDEYARLDAVMTLQLAERLTHLADIVSKGPLWDIEREFERLLITLHRRGIRVDQKMVQQAIDQFEHLATTISESLQREGLENISNNVQVASFLYDTMGLVCPKHTPSGARSVDRKSLLSLSGTWQARKILEWRQYKKALATWLVPMLGDVQRDPLGRVHPQWKVASTRSSRISCENPNIQQIPLSDREHLVYSSLKGIFTAPEGFQLVSWDYKQADLRLATILAHEDTMADAFREGRDPYVEMANMIWGKCDADLRFKAKRFSLATMYAMGARTAANTFDIPYKEAKAILSTHRRVFPRYVHATRSATQRAERLGHVELWTGRSLKIALFEPSHKAFAWSVQGGVAEMVKRAMLRIEELTVGKGLRSRQLGQIHDSVVLEVADEERENLLPRIKELMEKDILPQEFQDYCPMQVDVSAWG